MKKFLLISLGFLIGAILTSVIVFVWLSQNLSPPTNNGVDSVSSEPMITQAGDIPTVEGIPLRDLALSDNQKSALNTVGVNVETAVITPAMEICVRKKLGEERMKEIIAGSAPNVLETTKLVPCLSAK